MLFCIIPQSVAVPGAPKAPGAAMAGFTKIVVKWQPVKGAVSYKVYRDDKVVGTVDKPEYADPGLKPGTAYSYKIAAVNADGESPCSKAEEVRTLKKLSGDEATVIQKVVDGVEPGSVTAGNLLDCVQSSLKVLNVLNTDFVSIDSKLVKKMIDREMALAKDTTPEKEEPSDETLDDVMEKYYKGHSFLDLYIQSKLTELAEEHWQAGKKETAVMLYDKSLKYLPDMEDMVFMTLLRIAQINFSHITLKSSQEEMLTAIRQYGETLNHYYDYFPKAKDLAPGSNTFLHWERRGQTRILSMKMA